MLSQRDTIIPDIHGDERALLDSLERGECIEPYKKGKPLKITTDGNVILLGDYNDRGPDDLGVNDRILELMDLLKERLILLAGNHDVFQYRSLQTGNTQHLVQWLIEGGMTVLRSIAKRENLLLPHPAHSPFPGSDTAYLGEVESKKIHVRWDKQLQRRSAERYDFPAALERAKELFIQGPYNAILHRMKIVHEVRSNVWAVHAGVDANCATLGAPGLDRVFENLRETNNLEGFKGNHFLNPMLWMRQEAGELLDDRTSQILESQGIDLLIRGHQPFPRPTLEQQGTLSVLHLDTAMARGVRRKQRKHGWTYAEFDGDDLFVNSNTGGLRHLGYNDGNTFIPDPA